MAKIELALTDKLRDPYQTKEDKATRIVNDPNECSDAPRYIVDLVKMVVRVSMETVRVVEGLPKLTSSLDPRSEEFVEGEHSS